ncbi:McrB family protein [Haloimpatiens sp. FM7330]|uniref:McrB family protein n=1 Tax=Haloimpatiens sp. FM7330 TaxID=3298610 RepID=UPI00363C1950
MDINWDIYMVGTLAEANEIDGGMWKNSVFINNCDALQFYIKPISDQPENFPNVRYFTGYTSNIQDLEFEDDITLSKEERVEKLKKFLDKYLLIFKPVQRGENFLIREVVQVVKPKDYNKGSKYIPVPLFKPNSSYRSIDEFTHLLIKNEFLDMADGVSKEQSDTPSIIAWEDKKELRMIGEFTSHIYSRGKIKFNYEFLKYQKFKEDWYSNIINSSEIRNILFMGTDVYTDMEKNIEEGIDILNECGKNDNFNKNDKNEKLEENEFINKFIERTRKAGLVYNEKDLINFHTAMKISNLVILSGMSGTGKSKLVQMYGEALGLDSSQLSIIPVRPSWADDRDLLGYVDSIHNIYKPGDTNLIDTLVQAKDNADKLYIICFDEMNLARVEYYFSQFLSVLEMDSINRKVKLYSKDLESKLYNSDKYPSEIEIRDNILFVGTVNIDESTYHFSDKVLDRANVITLGIEDYKKLKKVKIEKKSKYDEITFGKYNRYKSNMLEIILTDRELELLNKINIEMNKTNKNIGIGFRIVKQIDCYLKNIPENNILDRKGALDLQIVQRVLTKIRGSQDQIESLIGHYNRDEECVEDSIIINLFNAYNDVSEFNKSKECIREKAKELKIYGYTI